MLPDMTEIGGKCPNQKFKCDILSNFQTLCLSSLKRVKANQSWFITRVEITNCEKEIEEREWREKIPGFEHLTFLE